MSTCIQQEQREREGKGTRCNETARLTNTAPLSAHASRSASPPASTAVLGIIDADISTDWVIINTAHGGRIGLVAGAGAHALLGLVEEFFAGAAGEVHAVVLCLESTSQEDLNKRRKKEAKPEKSD